MTQLSCGRRCLAWVLLRVTTHRRIIQAAMTQRTLTITWQRTRVTDCWMTHTWQRTSRVADCWMEDGGGVSGVGSGGAVRHRTDVRTYLPFERYRTVHSLAPARSTLRRGRTHHESNRINTALRNISSNLFNELSVHSPQGNEAACSGP